MARSARISPILGAVTSMIGEASQTLVTDAGRFRHSFEIRLDAIAPDPAQARKRFDEAEIAGLAASMREQGQLQPILVRRDETARARWIIIAGERRFRAAQSLAWPSILAIEHIGDPEIAALIENLQRVDLSPVEEARGLHRLIAEKSWSQDRAAAALGKTKVDVSGTLRILTLPEEIAAAVLTSELALPKNVLIEMARLDDLPTLRRLAALARDGKLTIRAIRQAAKPPEPPVEITTPQMPPLTPVLRALQKARDQKIPLRDHDREALHHLRAIIDALLNQP
jgi:ParB family chromosome partitioning protein